MNDITTANSAVLAGYTKEYIATNYAHELSILVNPDHDLDGTFKAFDLDTNELITVRGWLFVLEAV